MEPPISFARRGRARREGQGAARGSAARADRTSGVTSCARSTTAIRQEPNVAPDSRTETFVAMRLFIDNWRWAGVPFYLRTGKRAAAPRHRDRGPVQARAVRCCSAKRRCERSNPNVLVMRIQPDEGISLSFDAKVPGPFERLETVTMDFSYAEYFKAEAEHRLRDAAVRRDDRRSDAVPSDGHGRGRLAGRRSDLRLGERDRCVAHACTLAAHRGRQRRIC